MKPKVRADELNAEPELFQFKANITYLIKSKDLEPTATAGCLSIQLRGLQAAAPEIHRVNNKVPFQPVYTLFLTCTIFRLGRHVYSTSSTIPGFPRDELYWKKMKKAQKYHILRNQLKNLRKIMTYG